MSDDWSIRNPFLIKQTTNSLSKTETGSVTVSSTPYSFTQWDLAIEITSGIPELRINFRNAGGVIQAYFDIVGTLASGTGLPTIATVDVPTANATTITTSWTVSYNTAVYVKFFVAATAVNTGGTQIGATQSVASGTLTLSLTASAINGYIYAEVTPQATGSATLVSAASALYTAGVLSTLQSVVLSEVIPPDAYGYDIIIVAGQSNGDGWASPGGATPSNAKVASLAANNTDVVLPAVEPLPQSTTVLAGSTITGMTQYVQGNGKGATLNFAVQYANGGYLRSKRRVLVIQTSVGGVGFAGTQSGVTGWWQSTSALAGGACYTNLITRVTAALGQTFNSSSPQNNRVVAFCWQAGETDGQQSQTSQQYKANLLNLVTNFKAGMISKLTGSPFNLNATQSAKVIGLMSFLVGGVQPSMINGNYNAYGTAGTDITLAAKNVTTTMYGAAITRSAYVSTEVAGIGINNQDAHFTATEYDVLANSYATSLATLASTEAAALSAPNVTAALVFVSDSGALSASWLLPSASACTVTFCSNPTNSSSGGTPVTTQSVASGTLTCTSSATASNALYYYAIIKLAGVASAPATTVATLSPAVGTLTSVNVNLNAGVLSAIWVASLPTAVTVTFYSSATNVLSGGTALNGSPISVASGTLTLDNGVTLVSTSYYYAIVTPTGGAAVTSSGTVYNSGLPIPLLKVAFSATSPKVVDLSPSSRTFVEHNTPTYTINGRGTRTTFTATSGGPNGQFISISGAFPAGSFSKLAWVKWSAIINYAHILSGSADGAGGDPKHLFWNFSDEFIRSGLTDLADEAAGPAITTGIWKHCAATYDQPTNTMSIYVDGVLTTSSLNPKVLTASPTNPGITAQAYNTMFIGSYKTGESWFQGQMDDVRLYGSVLTLAQMISIMNNSSL